MIRYDRIDAPIWMTSKFIKTPEGFLKGRAVVCSTGVYEYLHADGTVVRELRLPEEVFSKEFLDSLKLKPLTLYHPDVMLTSQNVKQYQIGTLGDNPSSPFGIGDESEPAGKQLGYQFYNTDLYHVSIDMIIHDADAIKAVEDGTRALSVGYTCDLEPAEPGARWCGQSYDFIQRKLRANHTSLVDAARAGDAARIRLDSADAVLVHTKDATANITTTNVLVLDRTTKEKEDLEMAENMKQITLDGVAYSAEPKVLEVLHLAQTKIDDLQKAVNTATTDKTKAEADRDTFKDRVDALELKVKELEGRKIDDAAIAAAVARRVRILDAARVAEIEVKDGMSELDIQKAVIVKTFPKAKLDGKDATYIDARFDGAIEALDSKAQDSADAATRELNVDPAIVVKNDEAPIDSSKAREKMIADLKSRYKNEKK